MKTRSILRPFSLVLVAALALAAASRTEASVLLLSDVHIEVDVIALTATVSASLEADTDDGSDLSLDGLSVDLRQDGTFLDLFAGPTLLDDLPFLVLPASLADGHGLPVSPLFHLTGLAPGATYVGSFALQFSTGLEAGLFSAPEPLSFSTAASVPEPATLFLMATGLGATGLAQRRRRRQGGRAGRP
jgi:hypothetical protein